MQKADKYKTSIIKITNRCLVRGFDFSIWHLVLVCFLHFAICSLNKKAPSTTENAFRYTLLDRLEVYRANSLAAVILSALYSFLDSVFEKSACACRKVTRSHHTLLLNKLLELGCNYVTHNVKGVINRNAGKFYS